MNELEHKLRTLRLAAPSAELDRRLEETFSTARKGTVRSHNPGAWWWLASLATAGGMAALLAVAPRWSPPDPTPQVVLLEAPVLLREMLLNPAGGRERPLPPFTVVDRVP